MVQVITETQRAGVEEVVNHTPQMLPTKLYSSAGRGCALNQRVTSSAPFIFKVIYWYLPIKMTALYSMFSLAFGCLTAFPTLPYQPLFVYSQSPDICLPPFCVFQGLCLPGFSLSSGFRFICGFSGHCSSIFIILITTH